MVIARHYNGTATTRGVPSILGVSRRSPRAARQLTDRLSDRPIQPLDERGVDPPTQPRLAQSLAVLRCISNHHPPFYFYLTPPDRLSF